MPYSEKKRLYNEEYTRENYRRFSFRVQKAYYENVLAPAIKSSGETDNMFIRKAVEERVERLNQ